MAHDASDYGSCGVRISSVCLFCRCTCRELYGELTRAGATVLYDDRDMRAGEKFAESDLLGMPWRITVGKEALSGNGLELINRATGEVARITKEELIRRI